jgi:hypothetical protein
MCYGVPIGENPYVKRMLAKKAKKITAQGSEIATKLDPSTYPEPDIFCNQALLLLITRCHQFKGNYWVRHVSPLLVDEFVATVDKALLTQLTQCTGLDVAAMSPFSKVRLMLSTKRGGLGIKLLADVQHAEWIGGFVQGTSTLINTSDQQGNRRNGRAHVPVIVGFMGKGSLDAVNTCSWETLLSREDCPVANGLRQAHGALMEKAATLDLIVEDPAANNLISIQPILNCGFDSEGKIPKSTTASISIEFDKAREKKLISLAKADDDSTSQTIQESLSFFHCDRYSTLPLSALPNTLGSCPDIVLPEIIAQIMGQPSPCCKYYAGQWIGTDGNEQPVDEFGNSVASSRFLPGGDFQKISTAIQMKLLGMAKKAGLSAYAEATGYFAGRVAPIFLNRYLRDTMTNPDAEPLIPDVIIHNFKNGICLMGEVKRNGVHAGYRNYKKNSKAVDVKARAVRTEYI